MSTVYQFSSLLPDKFAVTHSIIREVCECFLPCECLLSCMIITYKYYNFMKIL